MVSAYFVCIILLFSHILFTFFLKQMSIETNPITATSAAIGNNIIMNKNTSNTNSIEMPSINLSNNVSNEAKILPKKRKLKLFQMDQPGGAASFGYESSETNNTNNNHKPWTEPDIDLSEWIDHRVLARQPDNDNIYLSGVIKSFDLSTGLGVELDSNHQTHYYNFADLNHLISDCVPSARQLRVGTKVVAKCSSSGGGVFREGCIEAVIDTQSATSKSQYQIKCHNDETVVVSRANLRLVMQPWADEDEDIVETIANNNSAAVSEIDTKPKQTSQSVSVITMATSQHTQVHQQPQVCVF